jgi:hypothetical protein
MKNIYLLKLDECGYDEYDGWVVIAKDEKELLKLCDILDQTREEASKRSSWGDQNRFKDNIKEIKLLGKTNIKESQIVLGSYNAG